MGQESLEELAGENHINGPPRRAVVKGLILAPAYVLTACATLDESLRIRPEHRVNLSNVLKNELAAKREEPPLLVSPFDGKISDFAQHLDRRPSDDMPGLDFAVVTKSRTTEIVPAAGSYTLWFAPDAAGGAGMVIRLLGPFGYAISYQHLNAGYFMGRTKIDRNYIIGEMGKSGRNARDIIHLHLTLFGPAYSPYLRGIYVHTTSDGLYILDPEEFSISGKGTRLPYQKLDDLRYDEILWQEHLKAQKFLEEVLRTFPRNIITIEKTPAEQRLEEERGFRAIDKEIRFIYKSILEGKHWLTRNDADRVLGKLRELMQMVPRLTAPIREPDGVGYRALPFRKLIYGVG